MYLKCINQLTHLLSLGIKYHALCMNVPDIFLCKRQRNAFICISVFIAPE